MRPLPHSPARTGWTRRRKHRSEPYPESMTTMMINRLAPVAFLLLPLFLRAADPKPPSAEEIARMEAAMPATPAVQPRKPRRLLIYTECRGYVHASIPYCSKAFELMGRKTGAFEAVVSKDPSVFSAASLKTFDAIVFDNATMRVPIFRVDLNKLDDAERRKAEEREKEARAAILDFVRSGKGFIGVHAATDCFYKWPAYGEMIGGYFAGHPWHEKVTIKLDDPGHPIVLPFNGQSFTVTDEIYQFRAPYSRETLRVLMSLDTGKTNMDKGDRIKRTDGDFPVAWIHEFGKGRVFYFSLGHRPEIFWNRRVLACYLRGIQYALGDLPADATPSARLSANYLKQSREHGYEVGVKAVIEQLGTYRMGVDDSAAKTLAAMVLEVQKADSGPRRADLSARLAALLEADVTPDCKRFVCEQLSLIGSENALPALVNALKKPESSEIARFALERIPGPVVETALLAVFPQLPPETKVGVAHTLAYRGTDRSVPVLAKALHSQTTTVAKSAAFALGKIGSAKAAETLLEASAASPAALRPALDDALATCGDALRRRKPPAVELARKLYEQAFRADSAPAVRAGAFYGLCMSKPGTAAPKVLAALKKPDPVLAPAAAELVVDLPGPDVVTLVAEALPRIPAQVRPMALDALGRRGDRRALMQVLGQIKAADERVRMAALRALQFLGDERAVPPLAAVAADPKEPEAVRESARSSLDRMRAPGVDGAIAAAVAGANSALKAELVRALGGRKTTSALPLVLDAARDADPAVRKAAREAVDRLAAPADLPRITALLGAEISTADKNGMAKTVLRLARKLTDDRAKTAPIIKLLNHGADTNTRVVCLSLLGRIGSPTGLPELYKALRSENDDIKRAAIKALGEQWPDPAPLEELRKVSLNSKDPVHRVLALRGYARLLAMPSRRPMKQTLAMYKEALSLARGDQEKRALLGGLAALCHPDALAFVKPYIDDPAVQTEALTAAVRITEALEGQAMKFQASADESHCRNAVDGVRDTRWTSGARQKGGEWFMVDLGYETDVKTVWLDAGPVGSDWPRAYQVYVSRNGVDWGAPVVTGKGVKKIFTITLPPTYGRFVKLVQTGTSTGNFWSIAEMRINGRPKTTKLEEVDRANWKVSASASPKDCPPENAIDGNLDTRWGTGKGQRPGDWFAIDMGEARTICAIILDAAKSSKDYPRAYKVFASLDGKAWRGPIGLGNGEKALTRITVLPTKARHVKIEQTGDGDNWWWSVYDLKVLAEVPERKAATE